MGDQCPQKASKDKSIYLKGKEHKEAATPHPCLKTPRNELYLCESLGAWQGGVLWWVQIVMRLVAAVTSKGAHSHVGIWRRFCN